MHTFYTNIPLFNACGGREEVTMATHFDHIGKRSQDKLKSFSSMKVNNFTYGCAKLLQYLIVLGICSS